MLATEAAVIGAAFLIIHFAPWGFKKLRAVLSYDLPGIDADMLEPSKGASGQLWFSGLGALNENSDGVSNDSGFKDKTNLNDTLTYQPLMDDSPQLDSGLMTDSEFDNLDFIESQDWSHEFKQIYADMDQFEREDWNRSR